MSEWQPIESAPKNGTRVLGYSPASGMVDVFWYGTCETLPLSQSEIEAIGEDAYFLPDWWQNCTDGAWRAEREYAPTHWQPLPTPPATQHEDTP